MEIWIIFQSETWVDADWHIEWNIYGVYSSEEKANEAMTSLQKEEEDYYNSLSNWEKENEYEAVEYRIEKHSVQ